MRRLCLLTVALAATLAPGAAQAAQSARLDVAATLLDQPVGRPWAIDLAVTTTVSAPDGSPPAPLKDVDLSFPHATINADRFPVCDPDRLRREGRHGCPPGSHIGSGRAQADVRPLLDFPIDATIDVYNGPRRHGGRVLIFDARAKQVTLQLLMEGLLRKARGRFGHRLTLTIPPINTIPGSGPAAISMFSVTVGARRGGRSYLEAPRACPRGGLPFAGRFTYRDGTSSTARAAISCVLSASSSGHEA